MRVSPETHRAHMYLTWCLALSMRELARYHHGNTAASDQLTKFIDRLETAMAKDAQEPRALLPFARWWTALVQWWSREPSSQDDKGDDYLTKQGLVRVRDWEGTNKGMPRWVAKFSPEHINAVTIEANMVGSCVPKLGMDGVQE